MPDQKCTWDFEQAVLPHLDAAYNLARWLVADAHEAEDVVQDACMRALAAFGQYRGGDPRAWLTVTARHKAYDMLRREAARPGKELAAAGDGARVAPDVAPEVLEMAEPDSVVRTAVNRRLEIDRP